MNDSDLEQRLAQLRPAELRPAELRPAELRPAEGSSSRTAPATGERFIDTARAWREFQLLRARRDRNRRRLLGATAAAAAAAIAVAVPVLARIEPPHSGPVKPGTRSQSASPAPSPRSYPGAVAARIKLGGVSMLVQDGTRAWAVRGGPPNRARHFTTELVGIDLRTNKVVLRKIVGPYQSMVAAGGRRVWVTTPGGHVKGQIQQIDPATGRVIATMHLPAGRCYYPTYASGSLWATCSQGRAAAEFFRIDPATGRVLSRAGPGRGKVRQLWNGYVTAPQPFVVARDAVWYINGRQGVSGVTGIGGRERNITVNVHDYPAGFDYHAQSLTAGEGFVWLLTEDESVAKIDPATGRVVQTYTYRTYDPNYDAAIAFIAVGHRSMWFIDGSGSVVRVNLATGRPVSQVPGVTRAFCRYQCGQVYSTPSAIWVPGGSGLIRIDPGRLPG